MRTLIDTERLTESFTYTGTIKPTYNMNLELYAADIIDSDPLLIETCIRIGHTILDHYHAMY